MSSTATTSHLRLVGQASTADDASAHAMKLERRNIGRWPLRGHAVLTELAMGRFNRSHEADLLDHSEHGYGLMCADPVEPGTWVSMQFDGLGMPLRRGVVVRCQRCADGWRLSVQVEHRRAA